MVGVVLLFSGTALLAAAAALTTALLRPDSRLDAAITFGVVGAAGAVVSLLAAGAVGLLHPGVVLALQAAWALGAAAVLRRRDPARLGGRPRAPRLPGREAVRAHPWAALAVALAAVALAWQLLVGLVLPPFAYDALTYHLTMTASWLREANVDPTPLSLCCARYPANAELLFTWPVLLLGTDTIVDTVQLGFAVLGALAVAGIARTAGLGGAAQVLAGALFAVTPAVLAQSPTDYADVIVAACVLAALHALARFAVTGAPERLVVAGLATGLVLGIKGTGIVWAAALILTATVLIVRWARAGRPPRGATARAAAAFLVACLALGSYWYVRNWIEVDNPVYPFRVEVGSKTLFEGPLRVDDVLTDPDPSKDESQPVEVVRSWAADLDFWRHGSYDYEERLGGLGPLWPWLGLPLLLALTVGLVRRRSPALVALAATALVFVVQPYAWWARFTIPLMALGAIAIAARAEWAPRRWMRVALPVAALALAGAGVVLSSYEVDPAGHGEPLKATDLVRLVGKPSEERTIGRLFFPEYRFLERVPERATVVVDLHAEPVRFVYPLFGPRHRRDVRPARGAVPLAGAWHVTSRGRPLERALRGDPRFRLESSERGLDAWRPVR
jgi:hypothetical protein